MNRIQVPTTIQAAPAESREMLEGVKAQLGTVPNLFRLVALSPAALEGYLGMSGALAKGKLPRATHERIALAVAEVNGCDYCLSAHSYLARNLAKLADAEIAANRSGASSEPRADAAVAFAAKLARERGRASNDDFGRLRMAGYDDGEIIEIIQHVALNVWTNYVNVAAQTAIDFPVVNARRGG